MRDLVAEFKALRLHGMANTWAEALVTDGTDNASARQAQRIIEQLLEAEHTDRALRSTAHQMAKARFPAHRDLAGFDFDGARVDRLLVEALASLEFTEAAHNVVFIGGPGTGKTHLATALGVAAIQGHGKRVRFVSTVDLVVTVRFSPLETKGFLISKLAQDVTTA